MSIGICKQKNWKQFCYYNESLNYFWYYVKPNGVQKVRDSKSTIGVPFIVTRTWHMHQRWLNLRMWKYLASQSNSTRDNKKISLKIFPFCFPFCFMIAIIRLLICIRKMSIVTDLISGTVYWKILYSIVSILYRLYIFFISLYRILNWLFTVCSVMKLSATTENEMMILVFKSWINLN